MSLYSLIQFITVCVFFMTVIIAVAVTIRIKELPAYLRYFYLYPVVGLIDGLVLLSRQQHLISLKGALLFDNYSLLYHFSFLSFTLSQKIIKKGLLKSFTKIQYSYLLGILILLVTYDSGKFNSVAYGVTNTGLFIICLIYYIQLFNHKSERRLSIEPFFWIVNGIFFGAGIAIPIHLTGNYFYKSLPPDTYYTITAIGPFAYLVMYLFFVKAYFCMKSLAKKSVNSSLPGSETELGSMERN